jgi:5-formyltetrahydrofolate cyclo-ligase
MYMPTHLTAKEALRLEIRERLRITRPDSLRSGRLIASLLSGLSFLTVGRALAAYMALGLEPDISDGLTAWLKAGGALYLPAFFKSKQAYAMVAVHDLDRQLHAGHYGIREPRPELPRLHPPFDCEPPWIWLVPGLAFDQAGNRLGRGRGYYDRLLTGATGIKIGVAHDCQIVPAVPTHAQDVRMDYVVTETRVVSCGGHSA